MIVKNILLPCVEIVDKLTPTERGNKGFGSTNDNEVSHQPCGLPPFDSFNFTERHAAAAAKTNAADTEDIMFSDDPFDNQIVIKIERNGSHPTLGLDVEMCKDREQPRLISCSKGEPAGKIQKWRSTLRGSYVLAVDGITIANLNDIKRNIQKSPNKYVSITFGTMNKTSMHPQRGVPQLYFDQLHKNGEN